jgi:hypothetical protein
MSDAQTANVTPKDDRRRRRGGKKAPAAASDAKAAAPAKSNNNNGKEEAKVEEKPTLKKILNDMNRQINPKLLSDQDKSDLSTMLQKILDKLSMWNFRFLFLSVSLLLLFSSVHNVIISRWLVDTAFFALAMSSLCRFSSSNCWRMRQFHFRSLPFVLIVRQACQG